MTMRFILVCLWTVAFLFSAAVLHILAVRFYAHLISPDKPSVSTTIFFGFLFILISLLSGVIGLGLGVSGRLPGTRKKHL
jgi:hypothetical protein